MLPRTLCLQVDRSRAFQNVPNYTESRQVNIFRITAAVTSNLERTSVTALVIGLVIIIIIITIKPFSRYDDCLTK
jgi:hypothetical protein